MRFTLILFAGLFVVLNSVHARDDQRLDAGWRFLLDDPTNAQAASFSDTTWETVSLPHNWGWKEAQAGKTNHRGPGWYRRDLDVPVEAHKRYFLRFEAASLVADVYLNGQFLGEHRGGFGAFCFEITKDLSDTGTNLLAVRVDNSRAQDIAPQEGDFSVYGGLYRPVHLITTDDENIALTDHASPGAVWSETSVSAAKAVLDVTAEISNGLRTNEPVVLTATVFNTNGEAVAQSVQTVSLAPHDTAPYYFHVTVPHPHLWNGRKDPYLYRAVVELRTTNNISLDLVKQSLGLRFYSIDPDKGFFLNGQPYHVHGVARHQDYMNKGWAITEADMEQDVALLKELGVTAVRCAHYQHSDYFYSLCDRAGILVWAEIPQVNVIKDTPEFAATSRNQLLDLIRQSINHPSIFCWSLSNEIGSHSDDPHRELQDLSALAHGEDPTRPTIEATMTAARPQMNRIPDQLGWNIYPGWYNGKKEDYGRMLDERRDSSKLGGFCVSEYGAGANTTQHEDNPRQPKPGGPWHPEEWQADVHEAAWAALKERPFVWGTFVWVMFDFAVHSRHEGSQPGLNDKGLVTRDRQTKKDAFFFYKANWSDEPVLYLTSRRFVERTNAVTDVKIYSNLKSPELFVNGVSLGRERTGTNCVFVWKGVKLTPGANKISTQAKADGEVVTDECVWNLSQP